MREVDPHSAGEFEAEIERAVDRVLGLDGEEDPQGLQSRFRHFEALLLALEGAAELLAEERGLDPSVARSLIQAPEDRSDRTRRVLSEVRETLRSTRPAPLTPTAFLGRAYESLYGRLSSPTTSRKASGGGRRSLHRRDHGVFFTPPDMAEFLTQCTITPERVRKYGERPSVLDPACGSGIFLSAVLKHLNELQASRAGSPESSVKSELLKRCLFGVDRDATAVSIARTVLWLEAGDVALDPVILSERVVVGDSLVQPLSSWVDLMPASAPLIDSGRFPQFDIILTNPPWGGVKALRREFVAELENVKAIGRMPWAPLDAPRLLSTGSLEELWSEYSAWTKAYGKQLLRNPEFSRLQNGDARASGDPDLYQFFMLRVLDLARQDGTVGMVIPAGFQRSLGATTLRKHYLENGTFEYVAEIINRKRMFPIHGMFRFLLVVYQRGASRGVRRMALGLTSLDEARRVSEGRTVGAGRLSSNFIKSVSRDHLAFPNVRSPKEAQLLRKLYSSQPTLGDTCGVWLVRFRRELDMTNDASRFTHVSEARRKGWHKEADGTWNGEGEVHLPVYEGRMVHQFDSSAKGYRSGRGRQALWEPLTPDAKSIDSQFLVPQEFANSRMTQPVPRAVFCDVTGHANERTVLASMVLGNAVCGNKVPVCLFEPDDERLPLLWVALANSFIIDWLVRRWVSTTLNFFFWRNIPFPRIHPGSPTGRALTQKSALLLAGSPGSWSAPVRSLKSPNHSERQQLRADIDAIVADLFGISAEEYAYLLEDFPLVDRAQPKPEGGSLSITKDLALLALLRRQNGSLNQIQSLRSRIRKASEAGAFGYVPAEQSTS